MSKRMASSTLVSSIPKLSISASLLPQNRRNLVAPPLVSDNRSSWIRVNAPRKLQSDELATVRLFQENTPSVVYITNLAVRTLFTLDVPQDLYGIRWATLSQIIMVTRADQTTYDAEVIGFDQEKDVAVLLIDAPKDKSRPLPIGVSADLLVGQKVYAIGNPVNIEVLHGDHLEKVPVVLEPKPDES